MIDELLKIIFLLSVVQGLTFSLLLLFKKKGDKIANRILALLILLMVIPLWNEYILTLENSFNLLIFSPKALYFQLLYGPLIYLYTVRYTKSGNLSIFTYSLLLAGPIFGSLFKSSHFYLVEGGFSQFIWYLFFVSVIAHIAICLFASWLRLKQHNQDILQNLSNLEKSKLDWLKLLIYGYALLLAIDFVLISSKILGLSILDLMRLAVNVSESLFIFFIGFWGMSKQEIHFEQVLIKANRKYDNSTLSQSGAETLVIKLRELMKNEEVFLDNNISLVSLSKTLKITPHHLSQALNEQLGQNFYDFINSARIERAKDMLVSSSFQKLSIIDVAYQVGFNNKTSFNNAFKKYTQVTPTQYRSQIST
jgi:AraC-like DNA-binding protein